ncbi:hypothetical protein HCB27_00435 [Listeria booriae]|uniref:Uncharacterized protein n=1 Tax=Listeria booriae TaxID=1552123 RepID=A0A7X0Z310_9LIST|nr:hypothetical protein [Listeria booriae]MBC2175064.1 hypothetical protein [Listeria booriae]
MQTKEPKQSVLEKLKQEWQLLLELDMNQPQEYTSSYFDTFQKLVSADLVHVLFADHVIVYEGLTKNGEKLREALRYYVEGKTNIAPILLFDIQGFPVRAFTTMEEAAYKLGVSERSAQFYLETGGVSISGQKLKLITE